jgi:hypothetical protein
VKGGPHKLILRPLPSPEGPGSVPPAPHLPAGFDGTFTAGTSTPEGLREHAVIGGGGPPLLCGVRLAKSAVA